MKHLKHWGWIALIPLFIITAASCKKSYLTDGGLAKAVTPLSNYDYLAGNAYHQFDTMLMVVDHYNLKDTINMAGTFFAPTDVSISSLLTLEQWTSLDSLYAHCTSKFITQYCFADTSLSLYSATIAPVAHPSWADTIAGLKKTASTYLVVNTNFTYYTLQYIKINGQLDGVNGPVGSDPADVVLNCQTTGVLTSNGKTNLNVLEGSATLDIR